MPEVSASNNTTPSNPPARVWPPRLTRREVPEYLRAVHGVRVGYQHLAKLAVLGTGPAFRKQMRIALYDRAELDRWANERLSPLCKSTAEHFVWAEKAGSTNGVR